MAGEADSKASAKHSVALWTVAIPAVVGLIGGLFSGGLTAYVQLSTKRDEISIERAKEFRGLMEELLDEKKSRLAVLNLWQLYPDERDRRVITAAAFAVNQPDLVQLVAGIDSKVNPVADMLHVRALSTDPAIQVAALRTLISVDSVRAAKILIDKLNVDIETHQGKLPPTPRDFNPMLELERLTAQNDTISSMVADQVAGQWGFFFDYLLYRSGRDSGFISRIEDGYGNAEDLDVVNDYLYRARFHKKDRSAVIKAAGNYFLKHRALEDPNEFKLAKALTALKNGDLYDNLKGTLGEEITLALVSTVKTAKHVPILRRRALELLDSYAPQIAVSGLVHALVQEGDKSELGAHAPKYLSELKMELLSRQDPDFQLPDCGELAYVECVSAKPDLWKAWLKDRGV